MKNCLFAFLISFIVPFSLSVAAGAKGGDGFRGTADEHELSASKASSAGNTDRAKIYTRMAGIKREAAQLADQGRWSDIDWSEYFELKSQLAKSGGAHKK